MQTEPVDYDLLTPVRRLRSSADGRATLLQTGRSSTASLKRARQNRGIRQSKWKARRFVAWDGEGVTVRGRHRYVILASSAGDVLLEPKGIQTVDAFRLLLDAAQRDKWATHVIFAGSYDVNMILRPTLQRYAAHVLADTGQVSMRLGDQRYGIRYHPRHEFYLTEQWWDNEQYKLRRRRSITLWDVFGSWQSSFVSACRRTLPDADLVDLEHIEKMKGRRGSFTLDDIDDMLVYCQAELKALVRLCETDTDNFAAAGFQAVRWDGAGAKASAILRAKRVGEHMEVTPSLLHIPIRAAYAGGRIESVRFGRYDGPLWTLDIRSAYPWAATSLPTLIGGRWEHVTGSDGPTSSDEFSVWHVKYRNTRADDLHPLFWRGRDGRICYPQSTEGWYWAPEVHAAMAYRPGTIRILEGWRFHPALGAQPFGFVPELFRIRHKLDQQVKGRGWPLKLALNSLYGKLAQQIGGKDGKPPRWHQLEWAGWITSKVRAAMYTIAIEYLDQIVSIETDGLSILGVPSDDILALCGPNLGDYEITRYDAGSWVQSGIYWLHDTEGWHEPKVRGVGHGALDRGTIEAKWACADFGTIDVSVTRFRGLVTSCLTPTRWRQWGEWVSESRAITVCPDGKRIHAAASCPTCLDGSDGLHWTLPTGGGSKSSLHTLAWEGMLGRTTNDEWWFDTLATDDSDEGD